MTELFVTGARIDWERVGKNSWLRRIPALNGLGEISFRKNVTFLAGENGSGKSTLLEAIAVASGFNPEGGTRNYRFCTYEETLELLRHIHTLAEAGAQFIVVTHSPFLLGLPGAEILSLSEKGLVPCAYEETESFRITEMFLRHRQTMLKELL